MAELWKKSGVYAIRCVPTSERYVGSSQNVGARWSTHKCELRKGCHANVHLQRAWDMHGEEAFEVDLLVECAKDNLLTEEQKHIDYSPAHYNIHPIAGRTQGVRRRSETLEKMRARCRTQDYRDATRERSYGFWRDPEHKARMTELSVERWSDPDYKADVGRKISGALRAKNARYHYEGQEWSPIELAEHYGLDYTAFRKRLNSGWSVERAVTQPFKKYRAG